MSVIIHLLAASTGEPTPFDDQYVVEYDPEQDTVDQDGNVLRCRLVTTPDPAKAQRFQSAFDALDYARQIPLSEPFLPGGIPNRPLTMFTMTFDHV